MRTPRPPFLALALGLTALPAWAVDTTLTSAGYTGLGITPNAQLLPWGRADFTYDNQLPGNVRRPDGHNFVLGFGLLPNLEVAGRLATNTIHSTCFGPGGCGARDLSASGKLAIGLDADHRWSVGVGATDVGGSVTYFRTYYGVLTYDQGPLQASAGLARRSGAGVSGSKSPLDGPFASLAWQPLSAVRGHLEYTDGNTWAGLRLFAPQQWLPEGWQLSAGANVRLNKNTLTERTWWTASLSIPLYKVPALPGTTKAPLPPLQPGEQPLPAYEARVAAPASVAPTTGTAATQGNAPPAVMPDSIRHPATAPEPPAQWIAAQGRNDKPPVHPTDAQLHALADALQANGLEDLAVGRMPDGTVAVRANNGSYRWNAADALGVALGAVARTLGDSKAGYRVVLTQRQVPLVAVTGQADCLRQWIEQPASNCTAGQLSTPGALPLEPLHDGAAWVVQRQNPGWQTVRVNVSPVLRTTVGTEVGAYDYALGANVGALLPLWAGASVDYAVNVPLANSDDFEPNRVFGDRRIRSGTDRLAFTQTLRLPLENWGGPRSGAGALSAQATVGRIGTYFDGALGELRWEPGEGRHRLSAQVGAFRNNQYNGGLGPLGSLRRAVPILGSYRYSVLATRTDIEATAGRFMQNDRGFQIGMRQWFSDVSVGFYYKRTAFQGQPARQLAGVEVTLPIGPRRDWRPLPHLQLGGAERFAHSVETSLREGRGNPLRTGHGMLPPTPSLNQVFNSDRSGLAWFEDNMRRIRDAAR